MREESIVDAAELAVDAEDAGGLDAGVCGCLGIEDPAVGVGDEFVALVER